VPDNCCDELAVSIIRKEYLYKGHTRFMKPSQLKQYVFKKSDDVDFPFEIKTLEKMPSVALSKNPHRCSFYEIYYLSGGQGTHAIDFQTHVITPPVFHFVSPGQIHYWEQVKPLKGFAIFFTEDFLVIDPSKRTALQQLAIFHGLEKAPYLDVSKTQQQSIISLIHSIELEYTSNKLGSSSVIRSYLNILLVHILRFYQEAHPLAHVGRNYEIVHQFKKLVGKHFRNQWSVEQYAAGAAISPGHLREVVKATTGQTPGKIIRNAMVLESKRLLLHTNKTIADIGYLLTFEDPSYFARFFKRETGMSPSMFRSQSKRFI
jgi:AraC family transcriptional regulator, transcriptional activator of pobA